MRAYRRCGATTIRRIGGTPLRPSLLLGLQVFFFSKGILEHVSSCNTPLFFFKLPGILEYMCPPATPAHLCAEKSGTLLVSSCEPCLLTCLLTFCLLVNLVYLLIYLLLLTYSRTSLLTYLLTSAFLCPRMCMW